MDLGGQNGSVGDVLPDGYGYIRRLVKIKGLSNATIGYAKYTKYPSSYINTDNVSTHVFSILIDGPNLQGDVKDSAYQIDPSSEQITINITDLRSTITNYATPNPPDPPIDNSTSTIKLTAIGFFRLKEGLLSFVTYPQTDYPYIDGNSTRLSAMPATVKDNITLRISPETFNLMQSRSYPIYIALKFDVSPNSTFLNNSQTTPGFDTLTFDNSTPFNYNYEAENVTQPSLRDAVLEVAVW
jgi:hypothetical protein